MRQILERSSRALRTDEHAPGDKSIPPRGHSAFERAVLRVLWSSQGDFLVRSEVHRRMAPSEQPTVGRVGQILKDFFEDGYVDAKWGRSQGSAKASFYALSDSGVELCQELGIERQEKVLFPETDTLLEVLTPSRLALVPDQPGQIIAAYAHRGGLGKTTLVANLAWAMAERAAKHEKVLAVDLDLGAPALGHQLNRTPEMKLRGFGGLVIDYQKKQPRKRSTWLRSTINDPQYFIQPDAAEVPQLYYLPSGLGSMNSGLSPAERAEALAILRDEAGLSGSSGSATPKEGALTFFTDLRSLMKSMFRKTLVDTQIGKGLGAWIATQVLAEELLVCARMEDSSEEILSGLQAIISGYCDSFEYNHRPGGGVSFVLFMSKPRPQREIDEWIGENIVFPSADPTTIKKHFRVAVLPPHAQLRDGSRLVTARRKGQTKLFVQIVDLLEGKSIRGQPFPAPVLQALSIVMNPDLSREHRGLAAGILEGTPLEELARWVEWHSQDSVPRKVIDQVGQELIDEVLRVHVNRLQKKILGGGP